MFQNQEKVLPKTLILSASVAPSSFANKQYSKFSNEDLIKQIQVYGGMPEAVLQDKELMNIMLPIFRADYGILESSAKRHTKKLISKHICYGEKMINQRIFVQRLCGMITLFKI